MPGSGPDPGSWPPSVRELGFALAEADAIAPPADLRDRVMARALGGRPAGVPAAVVPSISPSEAFQSAVDSLDAVLVTLTDAQWVARGPRDLTVQGLVGHLIGVELDFQAQLDGAGSGAGETEHVASTQASAMAQVGRSPRATYADWVGASAATIERIGALDPAALAAPMTLHRVTLPVDPMLVIRAFEMWTHEEDIRRATGRPLAAPEPARVALMTQLAARLVPAGMARVRGPRPSRPIRLVLTGPGGGAWTLPVEAGTGARGEARVVMDAVEFCRLVANRRDPADGGVLVSGDDTLAADLLAGAAALALD